MPCHDSLAVAVAWILVTRTLLRIDSNKTHPVVAKGIVNAVVVPIEQNPFKTLTGRQAAGNQPASYSQKLEIRKYNNNNSKNKNSNDKMNEEQQGNGIWQLINTMEETFPLYFPFLWMVFFVW